MRFDEKVWEACKRIPKGRVSTYKQIGKAIKTKAYRAVGSALKRNPFSPRVPCHRVVKSDGSVGGYQGKKVSRKKVEMLRNEGVEVKKGKVDLRKYLDSSY